MGLLVWLGLRRANEWEPPTLLDWLVFDSPLQWLASGAYHIILVLRGRPFRPPRRDDALRPPIRVVCLSDTHDHILKRSAIPDGDLLIHCGDLTNDGRRASIQRQIDWLAGLPHAHKVFVCGNHDSWFDPNARREEDIDGGGGEAGGKGGGELDLKGLVYLENSAVTLEFKGGRKLNVYGSPAVPQCGDASNAFQYVRWLHPWNGTIPAETDVLITHTPPRHHLDLDLGCAGLLEEVWRVKPKLHVFGHIHWGHGRESIYFDECQRAYESVMARPKRGLIYDVVSSAAWMDAFRILWHGLNSIVWKWVMLGPGSNNGGLMVNAAVVYGNTGKLRRNPVTVVEL
ncbi:Metallo-dependent phosphatase-like protein [Bombardia bombarda]|uniref:Metallo-dependent phosphatase-like protein n=1 Tax=Bombardia bombarda TaxID=252184 RepID=A0AA39WUA2_9PEZI|nr:Metallo-dependent phosphatase-like protein [Bombardia bombarda]